MLKRYIPFVVLDCILLMALAGCQWRSLAVQPATKESKPGAQAAVIYLSPIRAPELWRVSADGQNILQITSTGGNVYDYAVFPDGSRIAYAARNQEHGFDLWEVDPQGKKAALLLPCATDWCIQPSVSPDGSQIAYSRRQISGIAGQEPGVPHLWLLDVASGETQALFADPGASAAAALWSPDGRYLAVIDEANQVVHVVDFQAKEDFSVPSGKGTSAAWSADSRTLFFTRAENEDEQPFISIQKLDVGTRKTMQWIGEDQADYSAPAITPDDQWAVVARRPVGGGPGKQLWLLRLDRSQRNPITDDPLASHASYHWNPDGSLLVFQRLAFGASDSLPEVVVWNRQEGTQHLLAQDAFLPDWIP